MRKEKFIYNTHTLRYEKVVEPMKAKLLRFFGYACAVVFTAFVFTLIQHKYFPSPKEKALQREIQAMKSEYQELNQALNLLGGALENIKERDAYAHRMIFGMDPIDDGIWEGGVGGHDQFSEFMQFKNAGSLMASLNQKVQKLKRQAVIQSKSLDEILGLASEKEEFLAATPSIKPIRSDNLARDVKLLSGFGMRIHPILKVPKMHYGIDFTAPSGTPVHATAAGKVVRAEYNRTFGNVVVIDHGFGYETYYAHLKTIEAKKGQTVTRGQLIGKVGNTGRSTAPHCHYEVHYKGKPVNPLYYCLDGLTPDEYQQFVEAAETPNMSLDYTAGE